MKLNEMQQIIKPVSYPLNIALSATLLLVLASAAGANPRPPGAPLPEIGLLYSESFDEPYQMPTNQVDPAIWTESWSGWALIREQSVVQPWIVPMMASTTAYNLDPERGAIRLWYMPGWNSTSTGQP